MKDSKRHIYRRWNSSQNEDGDSDEEKLLGMTTQIYPDARGDLDSDLSLQRIASNVTDCDVFIDKKESPPITGAYLLSSITASTPSFLSPTRKPPGSEPTQRIMGTFTRFPVRDPGWLTAVSFSIGSAVFVINAFFLLLPMVQPGSIFDGEEEYAGPATSILGSFIFLIGGWTAVLEAQNMKCAEIYVVEFENEESENEREKKDVQTSPGVLELNRDSTSTGSKVVESDNSVEASMVLPRLIGSGAFVWFPSVDELRYVYLHDPMFVAAAMQMAGASIFSIATTAAIPGVMDRANTILLNTLVLLPTIIGSLCFLAAALIQTIMTQDKWFIPAPWRLEWYVGFWNCIGSLGFALTGGLLCFGDQATFQAAMADFWGSWSFMIGSAIQCYLVMANYP